MLAADVREAAPLEPEVPEAEVLEAPAPEAEVLEAPALAEAAPPEATVLPDAGGAGALTLPIS